MVKENMLKYFEQEYNGVKRIFKENPAWLDNKTELVWKSMDRCLGIAAFLSEFYKDEITFEEIGNAYDELKEKLYALLIED